MLCKAGHYDAVVIGAGSGGLTAARTAVAVTATASADQVQRNQISSGP